VSAVHPETFVLFGWVVLHQGEHEDVHEGVHHDVLLVLSHLLGRSVVGGRDSVQSI
jgi:hypothetical protein